MFRSLGASRCSDQGLMVESQAPEVKGVSVIESPENIPIVFLRFLIVILVYVYKYK